MFTATGGLVTNAANSLHGAEHAEGLPEGEPGGRTGRENPEGGMPLLEMAVSAVTVMDRLCKANLTVDLKKTRFCVQEI